MYSVCFALCTDMKQALNEVIGMDMNFHVKSYQQLFDSLQKNVKTVDDLIRLLQDQMQKVARVFSLGKFELRFYAAKSVMDPNGQDDCYLIYESEKGFDAPPCEEKVQMDENCSAVFYFYPEKDTAWTQPQAEMLQFLSHQIFLMLERVKLVQLLRCISVTDLLTGALNTRGINETGGKLLAQGKLKDYACAFVNIKNFNYINRVVGARKGDVVLREFVRLSQNMLEKDEFFARMGGDNFVLLAKKEHMGNLLKKIGNQYVTVSNEDKQITFDVRSRIGVYDIRENQNTGEVINAASTAMHVAKMSGKTDMLHFDDTMLEKALRQKEVSQMFPNALENQEFEVFYQPKVTLSDNQLCGCEALVRWFRNGVMVPPMDFIPVLEREGSVCKLDFYVLERVCQNIQDWLSRGIEPVRISVNFSKMHLKNPNLAEEILAVLKKYNVSAKYIEVELTEMSGYESYETLLRFVQTMHENGVSTSIDDFGTGYSSLNLLKDLNVDIIKLDKSFLNNMEKQEKHRKNDVIVIKNIVNMVNDLDMEVIAEGVETQKQAEFLRGINCCMAQGFLFDRPLPHDEYEKRLSGDHVYHISETE